MLTKKSIVVLVICLFFIAHAGMAVMCARLKSVSAGEDHTLALMDDNTLWACGGSPDNHNQLGLDGAYNVLSLQQVLGEDGVGFLQNVATYDAGWFHSLAADANGTLWSWGTDDFGQLGNGPNEGNWDVPQKVHGVNDIGYLSDAVEIVYVSAGRSGVHSLVVDVNGYVYAWGNNPSGECGIGSTGGSLQTPFLVLDDDPETEGMYLGDIAYIIAVDAGVEHSLALDDEGYVWEWGGNNGYPYPQKVPGAGGQGFLRYIVGISTCYHSVAVDSNGFVYEWGYGNPYKVADGEMNTASDYLEDIVEVSAGSGYSMARTSDGHVLEWSSSGSPKYVEDGEMQTESGLLEGIISIGAGYYNHKLAVCENGYGWAWGTNNTYGKFGVGDDDPRPEPAQMLCAEASSSIYLTKTSEIQGSDPNCARPFIGMGVEDNYLVYEICYGNPITNPSDPNYYGSVYDVNIIDHLPLEVDFYSVTGGGVYDSNTHTVTWTIGELAPGDSNCLTLTVKVNEYARPGGEISNFVEMTADMYYSYATDTVPVCNWGSEIIYVDKDATGYCNGTSWDDAYTDLRDAFIGAQNLGADITAIWVAAGTYKPIYDMGDDDTYKNASFELPEDVGLFGHFGGVGTYETSTSQRNFADPNNETILEGQIGQNYYDAVYDVVSAQDIEDSILDGFTIKGGYNGAGVFLDNADVAIVNCKLKSNYYDGISAINCSYPDIHNCIFAGDNWSWYGLEMQSGSSANITNTVFKNHAAYAIQGIGGILVLEECSIENNNDAIYIVDVNATLSDCFVRKSGDSGILGGNSDVVVQHSIIEDSQYNGITLWNSSSLDLTASVVRYSGGHGVSTEQNSQTVIKNCWIHDNGLAYGASGIYLDRPVEGPLLSNNTICSNSSYGVEMSENGGEPNIINCIIYANDSDDLYRENGDFDTVNYCNLQNPHPGTDNKTGSPGFINPSDPNDFHIDETSQCKDAGDPNGDYDDETDIDGEGRIQYGRVDMGADEYYWPKADYNKDEIANFFDFAVLAAPWRTEDADINLIAPDEIDTDDLAAFCDDWLWVAPWSDGWMMAMGGGFGLEGMSLTAGTLALDSSETASAERGDALMLSAAESFRTRPQRLAAKSQKFYDITPATTITARQQALAAMKTAPVGIKEILNWLDEQWLSGNLDERMTEEQYLDFRTAVEESAK